MPEKPITSFASEKTFLRAANGQLLYKGTRVDAVAPEKALPEFINFIRSCDQPVGVGHNIQSFDIQILRQQFSKYDLLQQFHEYTSGFLDTLKSARKIFKKK